jgi:hypothetical protein
MFSNFPQKKSGKILEVLHIFPPKNMEKIGKMLNIHGKLEVSPSPSHPHPIPIRSPSPTEPPGFRGTVLSRASRSPPVPTEEGARTSPRPRTLARSSWSATTSLVTLWGLVGPGPGHGAHGEGWQFTMGKNGNLVAMAIFGRTISIPIFGIEGSKMGIEVICLHEKGVVDDHQ